MTTILSANYAHSDHLVTDQKKQNEDVRWVMCVEADSPLLGKPSGPWEFLPTPIRAPGRPRLESRYPKVLPWEFVDDDTVIWIDANMKVISPDFTAWALKQSEPLVCFSHPQRECIYEEVRAASWLPKHLSQPMHLQAAHYRAEGYPPDNGLYACGTMVSRCDDPVRRVLGEAWMYEQRVWCDHDQVSLPVVAHRLGISIGTFDANQLDNPYIKIVSDHR